jgi:aerobic-type carbon monoxide dehydrogenase small subunit (CoxS/CutS family)
MSERSTVPEPSDEVRIKVKVNGRTEEHLLPARRLLSDFLRDDLGLTGTHVGCEHGVCGACTVLLDGEPMRACISLAVSTDGHEITTVEGLSPTSGLSELQRCFSEAHGLQCGFCTPGILATVASADPADHPDDDAIRDLISGHLCRCTGYAGIVDAVRCHWGRGDA